MQLTTDTLTSAEVQSLDQRFNNVPTEQILAWAWERFGARAAIGTSFQGAGLVMVHLRSERGPQRRSRLRVRIA